MKFKIASDTAGRIRVRCGEYAFTKEQGYALLELLSACRYVKKAETCHYTGSVLLHYCPDYREEIITSLEAIRLSEVTLPTEKKWGLSSRIDEDFKRDLIGLLGRRAIETLLFPSLIRNALTLIRSVRFLWMAYKSLREGKIGVEVLDGAAIGASLLQGNFSTASNIMFLLRISDLLENYTHEKNKCALTESLVLNVDSVWLDQGGGQEVSVPLASVKLHDCIVVRTGSMIPVDGTVVRGEALVNQSSMTGEPLPVLKQPEDSVFAGTVVEEGMITIEVRALASETRISQIVDLIDHSESLKASIQGKAERMADRIVPFSFLLSGLVLLCTRNVTKAVSVLLVDYSCAIKLSTPISVLTAMREAANHKVMVKGGKYLEAIAEADTVVFDKTGTLTNACPVVSKVVPFPGYERDEVLRISACLEEHFPHSVARAIVEKAKQENLAHEEMHTEVEYIVAHGIATTIEGRRAVIGSNHFVFEDEGVKLSGEYQKLVEKETAGDSAIYLAIDGKAAGLICISDPPRKEAAEVIQQLKESGIAHTIMLTGDSEFTAREISRQLGIDSYQAQVLPQDKAAIVEELKKNGHKIIMIGDGINDSPALAAAQVSIAMKDSSDIAQEVADVVLLNSDLREVSILRTISQNLMTRINRNYGFIVAFNTILLGFGLFGAITPGTLALFHNASTMGICVHSMQDYLLERDKYEAKDDTQE